MKIIADTHAHTIASTHAMNTFLEMVRAGKEKGLMAVGITDHAPEMADAPHPWHFYAVSKLPQYVEGVLLLRGAEANIMDNKGSLDLNDHVLSYLDWIVASIHHEVFPKGTVEDCTNAYIGIANNPYVDVIGHSGTVGFEYDYERVIPIFKENHKLVEINNGTFAVRRDSIPNCTKIAALCKKYEVPIVVNSDAHNMFALGEFGDALGILKAVDFPEKLVVNADEERFMNWYNMRREEKGKEPLK